MTLCGYWVSRVSFETLNLFKLCLSPVGEKGFRVSKIVSTAVTNQLFSQLLAS